MGVTVDTNFIIDVLRADAAALAKSQEIDRRPEAKLLSTPVLYEVTSGLLYTRSSSEAGAFRTLASRFAILPFDEPPEVGEGRLSTPQDSLDDIGETLPGPLRASELLVGGVLEGYRLRPHAPVHVHAHR